MLIILPGHSLIAAALLAAALLAVLHGRIGHFPAVARLTRAPGPVARFAVAEIVNLQELREESRHNRQDGPSITL